MVINITLYRKNPEVPNWNKEEMEKVNTWQDHFHLRDTGGFINNVQWNYQEGDSNDRFQRPSDMNAALRWLEENMGTTAHEQYWSALQEMFNDPDLYFYISR